MKTVKRIIKRGILVMILTWMAMTAINTAEPGTVSCKTAQAATDKIKIPGNAKKKDAKAARKLNQTGIHAISYQWKKGRLVKLTLDKDSVSPALFKKINTQLKALTGLTDLELILSGVGSKNAKYKTDFSRNKKLKKLYISLPINKLDLSKNKKLESLTLLNENENYQLSKLNLSKNTRLKELSVNGAKITKLDLSKNIKLEKLRIGNVKISSLDLSRQTELKSLTIGDTDLAELELSKNRKLKNLVIGSTDLKRLDLSNLRDLYQVYVSDCEGLMFFLNNLPSLTLILLDSCDTLHVTNCSQLEEMEISSGAAKKIEIQNCPKLLPSNGFGIKNFKNFGQGWDAAAVYSTDLLYGSEHYYWKYGEWILRTEPML